MDQYAHLGIFLATALMAFVAIIALIVTNKNKKYPPFPTKG